MTPAARVQAAIEILDLVVDAARGKGAPADRIVSDWFKTRRFAGSKDRRAVRELVFAAIRACGPVPPSGRAAMLRLAENDSTIAPLFDGSRHGPAPVAVGEPVAEGGYAPQWLQDLLAVSDIAGDELAALLDRAPLDVRINTLRGDRATIVTTLPEPGEQTVAPLALRYPPGTRVEQWDAYASGAVEVQDSGSQLVCGAVAAIPGETVVDLCAGAGGKTLALAAAMENRGRLLACDIDRARLSRLGPRAERAGATNVETRLLDPGKEAAMLADITGQADAVLVDAPCSGTGTWRRNPEVRWRLDPQVLARFNAAQDMLLALGASLVRPGGRLIYVTCSLIDAEGAERVDAFLSANVGWSAHFPAIDAGQKRGRGTRLTPFRDRTDGFFVASLTSAC
ncbi:MAG: RsmB/NOP family class I SAM-dependent RNA methyltransferase [Novosphingobium sp.]